MTTTKPAYAASSALTVTALNGLASDTNLLAGWSSAAIDNTSNLVVDELVTGIISMGTTPTVSTNVEVWAWSALDQTPTYPDTISGSQGAITLTSLNVKQSGAFKLGQLITVDATTNRNFPFSFGLASLFGGFMPFRWGIFIVHNTVAALHASGNVVTRAAPLTYTNA